MFIIRESFTAKPGQATKLAKLFKEVAAAAKFTNARIMTDLTGGYNRVIMEHEVASLAEFETRLNEYSTQPMYREKLAGYTELWTSGEREILRVV